MCCSCQPYRSASASRMAPLCKNKSWSSTRLAVSHDDVHFSCRKSSLRELMFPEDRRSSNSSFSLRMAVCALFAPGAAGNATLHCCMRTRGHRIADSKVARPTRRASEETSCIALWPVNAGKNLFLSAFSKGAKADCSAGITRWK